MKSLSYRDERRLLDFLVAKLEDGLSGRTESVVLKVPPTDHCQLGVLAPWSVEQELEDQPAKEANGVGSAQAPSREISSSQSDGAAKRDPRTLDELPSLEPFSSRDDAGRRPPSALGLAIAFKKSDAEVRLRVSVAFAVYSRHFPDYDEQRRELGTRMPDASQHGKRNVTLVDKYRRHSIKLTDIPFVLKPNEPSIQNDSGAVQRELDSLMHDLRSDASLLRQFQGNRVVPVAALKDQDSYSRYIASLSGPADLPDLRAIVRVRVRPTVDGMRVEVHLCNDSQRDVVRPSNHQYSTLFDSQVSIRIEQGELMPIELLPVPEDYQYDRFVYALGRNAGSEVSPDNRTIFTRALARYEQPRLTTNDRVIARFDRLAEEPFPGLQSIWSHMQKYAGDWRERIIASNDLNLDGPALAARGQAWDGVERALKDCGAGME